MDALSSDIKHGISVKSWDVEKNKTKRKFHTKSHYFSFKLHSGALY